MSCSNNSSKSTYWPEKDIRLNFDEWPNSFQIEDAEGQMKYINMTEHRDYRLINVFYWMSKKEVILLAKNRSHPFEIFVLYEDENSYETRLTVNECDCYLLI